MPLYTTLYIYLFYLYVWFSNSFSTQTHRHTWWWWLVLQEEQECVVTAFGACPIKLHCPSPTITNRCWCASRPALSGTDAPPCIALIHHKAAMFYLSFCSSQIPVFFSFFSCFLPCMLLLYFVFHQSLATLTGKQYFLLDFSITKL